MKKAILSMVLGLSLMSAPAAVLACCGAGGGGGAFGLGLFGGSDSTAKVCTGNEFADLNVNSTKTDLNAQRAGGVKNTLDIMK